MTDQRWETEIPMSERFQRSYIPVNLTSVLGKMKAIIIKAISRYTDIYIT